MSLKYGIVGLPNIGKSTLFSALAKTQAAVGNFPFCTINPQEGVVDVPDPRLKQLASLVQPERVVPTTLTFVDIAGLVKGASKGEGLGNQFLANIREVDAILHVVRCFEDQEVVHVAGTIDPLFDKQVIDEELQLKDLATLQKRKERLSKLLRTGDKNVKQELEILQKCTAQIEQGENLRDLTLSSAEERKQVESWQLLTQKPVLYVANIDEQTLQAGSNSYLEALKKKLKNENAQLIPLCASLEAAIVGASEQEQQEFLHMYGRSQTGLDELIQTSYHWLNLITYFTAGKSEVRAWTIPKGTYAPQAAGIIHTDLERGFIKAEVIKLADYLHYRSEQACKQAGKIALEGKAYKVEDGDVIHFKHNS